MFIQTWPKTSTFGGGPTTVITKAEVLDDGSQECYQIVFHDTSENQLTVLPITDKALRHLVETGKTLLDLAAKTNAQSAKSRHK